jgi:hypothetical protein
MGAVSAVAHDAEPLLRGHKDRALVGAAHVGKKHGDDVSITQVGAKLLER